MNASSCGQWQNRKLQELDELSKITQRPQINDKLAFANIVKNISVKKNWNTKKKVNQLTL